MCAKHVNPQKPDAGSENSKESQAVRLTASIFDGLSPLIDGFRSKYAMHRLAQALQASLDAMSKPALPISPLFSLASYSFNEYATLYQKLSIDFFIDWGSGHKIVIHLPAIRPIEQLEPAPRIKSATLNIAGINIILENSTVTSSKIVQVEIPYENITIAPQKIVLPVPSHSNSISIIATSLEYTAIHNKKLIPVINKRWQPVSILDAAFFQN